MSDYHDIDIEECGTIEEIKDALEKLHVEACTHESAILSIDADIEELKSRLEHLQEVEDTLHEYITDRIGLDARE